MENQKSESSSSWVEDVTFSWPYNANTVVLQAQFLDSWKQGLNLKEVDGIFSVTVSLTPGLYQYKYIVNGNWCHNPLEPSLSTPEGYINNWLRVVSPSQEKSDYSPWRKVIRQWGPLNHFRIQDYYNL